MAKFKAGDRVYYPTISNELLTVQGSGRSDYPIWVIDPSNNLTTTICAWDLNPVIFHATPENKQALETLYGMEFEAV